MGRYIAWTDITGRYPDAARKAGDTPMGSYWLLNAEYEVDGVLAPVYTVPFTPCPPIVQDLCIDLTYFKMMINQPAAEPVKKYYDERIKMILEGKMLLTTSGGVLSGSAGGVAWSSEEGHHTSFGPDDPLNWQVSSQWMQDVDDERS